MHVTETVESIFTVRSERKLNHAELRRRTEKARVDGKLAFVAVTDVDIWRADDEGTEA